MSERGVEVREKIKKFVPVTRDGIRGPGVRAYDKACEWLDQIDGVGVAGFIINDEGQGVATVSHVR